jgi:hypothetical protein
MHTSLSMRMSSKDSFHRLSHAELAKQASVVFLQGKRVVIVPSGHDTERSTTDPKGLREQVVDVPAVLAVDVDEPFVRRTSRTHGYSCKVTTQEYPIGGRELQERRIHVAIVVYFCS